MHDTSLQGSDFSHTLHGISEDLRERLCSVYDDPARIMPQFARSSQMDLATPKIPSVDDIEEALNDHVRGGKSPADMIRGLFHPILPQQAYIDLTPGKGQKRPSYAIEISPFGLTLPRAATRIIAERLHAIATSLAACEIGDRSPEGSPLLGIEIPGCYGQGPKVAFKARDIDEARRAYVIAFGRRPASISVPLPLSTQDLITHVQAARHLIAEDTLGNNRFRQQALDLIAATDDLRAIATLLMRDNPKASTFMDYYITIRPFDPNCKVTIEDDNSPRESAHATLQFVANHRRLLQALEETLERHPVLRQLPESMEIRMNGARRFMLIDVINKACSASDPERTIGVRLLDYEHLNELAERLSRLHQDNPIKEASWRLSLSQASRSKGDWSLHGETLAQALAKAAKSGDGGASMMLVDMLIDMQVDEHGQQVEARLHRVVHGA